MKTLTLSIAFDDKKPGDVIEFDDRIARHFIAKKWAVEAEVKKEPKKKEAK